MLNKIRKTGIWFKNSFVCHFHQGNYIKITKCQVKFTHFFNVQCFTTVFIKWSNMATKETMYYKI